MIMCDFNIVGEDIIFPYSHKRTGEHSLPLRFIIHKRYSVYFIQTQHPKSSSRKSRLQRRMLKDCCACRGLLRVSVRQPPQTALHLPQKPKDMALQARLCRTSKGSAPQKSVRQHRSKFQSKRLFLCFFPVQVRAG